MSILGKDNRVTWLHVFIMIATVLLAYSKVFDAGFMSWDDFDYVFHTPDIHAFTASNISKWWTEYYIGNYQPLPMSVYAFDYMIGVQEPFIYHFTNIIWHIADVILVYACMKRMQDNVQIALFVALLFALHPVQTESVSWVAALNKVMNAFFFLLAVYVYIGYLLEHKRGKLIAVYVLGLAAYLCKLTAVTLPFALLAVDLWMHRPLKDKKVWLEKLPLILLAIPVGIINLRAQEAVSFLNLHPEFNFGHTVVFAGYAYVQYLVNLLVPVKLSVLYPYPTEIGFVHILYSIIAVAIVALGVIAWRKKWYVLAGGILFYTVNIAIVLQFVQFGEVLMADRYLYLACIGVWYPVVYFLFRLLNNGKKQLVSMIVVGALTVVYMSATYARNDIWLSELNFWESVTDKFPESSIAQSSIGGIYMEMGKNKEAEEHINKALEIDKNNFKAWHNKGTLLLRSGNVRGALAALNKSISIQEYPKALFTRALIYQQSGNCDRALADIAKVIEEDPHNARAYYIKGDCIEQQNKLKEALNCYSLAIQYEDQEPLFFLRKGLVEARLGEHGEAIRDISVAIDLKPDYSEAWYWRGMVKHRLGLMPCDDLNRARQLGMLEAKQALVEICNSY